MRSRAISAGKLDRQDHARAKRDRETRDLAQQKDEFLATLSHELRTPLNVTLGWIRLLRSQKLDPDTTARALEVLERNVQEEARLIAEILDMSQIVTGDLQLDRRPVDLARVAGAIVEGMRSIAETKGLELSCDADPRSRLVLGDTDRLRQVVWHLLTNAVKFTPRGGHIRVSVRERPEGFVELEVADSGVGIPAAFLPHVFDQFRQADATVTRPHGGLGLGLAIVRHLVELHGGSVTASSAGVDRGATFTIRLPANNT